MIKYANKLEVFKVHKKNKNFVLNFMKEELATSEDIKEG